MIRTTVIIVAILLTAGGAFAQQETPVVKLTLHPAAEASPALKYRLVPSYWERKPGNAAPFYYRALLMHSQNKDRESLQKEHAEKYEVWEGPVDDKTRAEMKAWAARFSQTIGGELREAVYREECDFDFRLRDRSGLQLISFMLPEVQEVRGLARFLAVKARVEIAEGRFDDALETLRHGYQISQDTGKEPLLINALVGVAIASIMNREVEQWVGSPDAPNLYWALTSLKHPFIDMQPAVEQEVRLAETFFPFLENVEQAEHSPEEWQRLLSDAVRQVHNNLQPLSSGIAAPLDEVPIDLLTTATVLRAYPISRHELALQGFDAARLEKMPVVQVVAIHMQRTARYLGDEFLKGAYLSPQQRTEYYRQFTNRLDKQGYLGPGLSREPIALASLLLPSVSQVFIAQTRLDRDIAALRVIEAIRAHLAATGTLPEKLSDITVLNVPHNPFTDESFAYHLKGDRAILEVPSPSPQHAATGKRYELTAAPKK